MERYFLMHKNISVARLCFDLSNGNIGKIEKVIDYNHLPISCQNNPDYLVNWWSQRAVSKNQSNIAMILKKNGIKTTQSFLLDNLGLSMVDSYWVKPIESKINWEDVSFHLNYFLEEPMDFYLNRSSLRNDTYIHARFTPSASATGELNKKWINDNGEIFLIKGNMPGFSFQQSINEYFASLIHRRQGFKNHVDYQLIDFPDASIGCISKCFTSKDIEFIPAWEIFQKYGNCPKRTSEIDWFAISSEKEGFDRSNIMLFLYYQSTTDFLLTNVDRHLSNFGLLRDSNTLEAISPAPIFDTGNSMFYLGIGIMSYKDLFSWNISSFYPNERKMMTMVKDYSLLDMDKIPTKDEVESIYKRDPAIAHYAGTISNYYEFKRNIILNLQRGISYAQIEKDVSDFFNGRNERIDINDCWKAVNKGL